MPALPTFLDTQYPLKLPNELKEEALAWVQTQTATQHRGPMEAPYRRLVDLWFAGVAWAVHKDLKPATKATGPKFVSVGPNPNDLRNFESWRAKLLTVLAIRDFGHEDPRSFDPRATIDLANRYAEVGTRELLNSLQEGDALSIPRLHSTAQMFLDELAWLTGESTQREKRG